METSLLLFAAFLVLMLAGAPLAVALGLSGIGVIWLMDLGIMSVPTNIYTGIAKYPLLAIPVFVLAGLIFERAGVAGSLVRLAISIIGQRTGALAVVAILVCMIMGGISGSGPADAAAVAMVMTASMTRAGYPPAFTASVIAAGASTAILIPPSIALIIYSVMVPSAAVPELFAASMIPGIIAGLFLMIPAIWLSVRHGFGKADPEPPPRFLPALRDSIWGLAAPIVILGGLRLGYFTPTEAGVVAVFYGLLVGVLVFRTITWGSLYRLLVDSAEISAVVMLIVAFASVFAWAGSTLGTFDRMAHSFVAVGGGEYGVLLLIMIMLLIAGLFLDGVSIFLITLPIILPIAALYKWDLVWLAVMMTVNIAIGQFTPPMAVNLMVTCKIANAPMEATVRWVMWFVLAMAMVMVIMVPFPQLATWLPRILGY